MGFMDVRVSRAVIKINGRIVFLTKIAWLSVRGLEKRDNQGVKGSEGVVRWGSVGSERVEGVGGAAGSERVEGAEPVNLLISFARWAWS